MFDIDTFKSINDRFGHLCGDAVLADDRRANARALRSSDVKCRYGGDEFLVILPETPMVGARQVCETLRRSIEKEPIAWSDGSVVVTASFVSPRFPRARTIRWRSSPGPTRRSTGRSRKAEPSHGDGARSHGGPTTHAPSLRSTVHCYGISSGCPQGPQAKVIVPFATVRPLTRARPSNTPMRLRRRFTRASISTTSPA